MNNYIEERMININIENIISIIFIVLSILNIIGNNYQKEYIISNNGYYMDKSNNIFVFVLIVILIIYLYFLYRNYEAYKNASVSDKGMFEVKLIGSILFVVAGLCLLYFQVNNN